MKRFVIRTVFLAAGHFLLSVVLYFVMLREALGCCSGGILPEFLRNPLIIMFAILTAPTTLLAHYFDLSRSFAVVVYLLWSTTIGISGAWVWSRIEHNKQNKRMAKRAD